MCFLTVPNVISQNYIINALKYIKTIIHHSLLHENLIIQLFNYFFQGTETINPIERNHKTVAQTKKEPI